MKSVRKQYGNPDSHAFLFFLDTENKTTFPTGVYHWDFFVVYIRWYFACQHHEKNEKKFVDFMD